MIRIFTVEGYRIKGAGIADKRRAPRIAEANAAE
jgi:hypothetical protein